MILQGPVPLPQNPYSDDPERLAYDRARRYEIAQPVFGRLLGYMLLECPAAGRAITAQEIASCADDDALEVMAKHFMNNFVKCCKFVEFARRRNDTDHYSQDRIARGRTPLPSYHASRPSLHLERMDLSAISQGTPADHQNTKALVRAEITMPLTN